MPEDPQQIWSDYFDRIKTRRHSEAEALWAIMVDSGFQEGTLVALDFLHFAPKKESGEALARQLEENYHVEISGPDAEGYWTVKGTTRPEGVPLDADQHVGWVEFMCDLARSYASVFSTWKVEVPSMGKSYSNEDIDSQNDVTGS